MPSRAEVDRYSRAQQQLVSYARRDLQRMWSRLDLNDLDAVRDMLEDAWPILVESYGSAAAEIAAEWMDDLLGGSVIAPQTNIEQANASMRWSLGAAFAGDTDQSLSTMGTVLDRLVKQNGRDTIHASCREAGVRYARVPSGPTCAWCLVLASRGAAYGSEISAGGEGNKYHGFCNCTPTPIMSSDDLPDGYDPADLEAQYQQARQQANSGSMTKITAALRELQHIH